MTIHSIFSTLSNAAPYITIAGGILALTGAVVPIVEKKLRPVESVLIARVEKPADDSEIVLNDVAWASHSWDWGEDTMIFELPPPPADPWRVFYAQRSTSVELTELEPLSFLPGLASQWDNHIRLHGETYRLWHMPDNARVHEDQNCQVGNRAVHAQHL